MQRTNLDLSPLDVLLTFLLYTKLKFLIIIYPKKLIKHNGKLKENNNKDNNKAHGKSKDDYKRSQNRQNEYPRKYRDRSRSKSNNSQAPKGQEILS